jgi:hypothetical protein
MKRPRPRFQFEVEILRDDEGRELRLEQARAIKDLLMWLQTQRGNPSSNLTIGPPTTMSTKRHLDRLVLHRCRKCPTPCPRQDTPFICAGLTWNFATATCHHRWL